MLRAWSCITRRLESRPQSIPTLCAASLHQEESTDILTISGACKLVAGLPTCPCLPEERLATSSWWPRRPRVSPPASHYLDDCLNPSASSYSPSTSIRPLSVCFLPAAGATAAALVTLGQAPASMHTALAARHDQGPATCLRSSMHQYRAASSSAASKAKSGNAAKAAAPAPPRVRTPEWARMPPQLEDVQGLFRRRKARLMHMRGRLQAEAAEAEAGGWAAAGKRAAAEAAAAALPIKPEDSGRAELTVALAPETPFEAACTTMRDLMGRGVVLNADSHLAPLLRKASSPAHLSAALELLRRNHLVQAAVRLGAHGASHSGLHSVLVKECQRLGSAAPLVELWDSLHEHGMEPCAGTACAAVQTAVGLRDGPAAVALLALTSQYGMEPLAAGEAPAVLALLEAGNAEEAASLRKLLPRLGIRAA